MPQARGTLPRAPMTLGSSFGYEKDDTVAFGDTF
jgi:hypothetical protein